MANKNIKIALTCTIGGHFEQLSNLSDFFNNYDHFWITNRNTQTESALKNEKKYYIDIAHIKKPWIYLSHFPKVIKYFWQEKPTHILSTGSGRTCLVPFLLSKLFHIKFIHIDTFSLVNSFSSFAAFLNKWGHPVFTQWEKNNVNHNVSYIGPIIKDSEVNSNKEDHIFVTLGTRDEPFTRLVAATETLVKNGVIDEHVIVQTGYTKYNSDYLELFDFCPPDKIDDLILNSKFVITQESAGIGTKCLKFRKKFLVMPRDYAFDELPAASDMKEDLHLKLEEMGYTKVVTDVDQLQLAIEKLDELKTGFKFDNSRAISKLTELVES